MDQLQKKCFKFRYNFVTENNIFMIGVLQIMWKIFGVANNV